MTTAAVTIISCWRRRRETRKGGQWSWEWVTDQQKYWRFCANTVDGKIP